jgi:hypothetical protein
LVVALTITPAMCLAPLLSRAAAVHQPVYVVSLPDQRPDFVVLALRLDR